MDALLHISARFPAPSAVFRAEIGTTSGATEKAGVG
jgi:hypothetical protein